MRVALAILLYVAASAHALAADPRVSSLTPHGGQRGTDVTVIFRGERLADTEEVIFERLGIEVLELKPIDDSRVEATLRIAKACPLGAHAVRLRTASGITSIRLLLIGALTEVSESEPNNSVDTANSISLNSTINGIAGNEDLDVFTFEGTAGQRVSAEVEGLRLGVLLFDAYVAILDTKGFELATCDDRALLRQDASVSVVLPENGTYQIHVRESSYAGNTRCSYRLHVGDFPRPTATLPLGGRPSTTVELVLLGTAKEDQRTTIELPAAVARSESSGGWLKPSILGVHIEDAGGIAPSPNYLRVVDLDNTIEVEPNNSHAAATPVNLPYAINGVLAEDGDQDCFSFDAKLKEHFLFVVFARQLRTPVDSVLRIHIKGGRQLASNDDSIGPDSVLDFTAPEDGTYVLTIHDHLRKGGEDFAYRIEAWKSPRVLSGALPKNAEAIVVPRGNRVATVVTATRFNVDGALVLGIDDLPDGVTVTMPAMDASVSKVPVVFSATPDAAASATMGDLTLKPADESITLLSPGRIAQDVELVLGRNNVPYFCHSIDRIPIVVVDEAPFSIELIEPKAPLVRSGSMNVTVRVTRKDGFDKPIRLRVPWMPSGVGASQSLKVKAGEDIVRLPFNANGNARLGTWPIVVTAEAGTRRGTVKVSSQLIQLTIAKPYVSLTVEPSTVEQGSPVDMFATIQRIQSFDGATTIRLGGLPNNVSCEAIELSFDQTDVVAAIKTTPGSPVGRHKNVFCTATILIAGEPVIHRLGWAELRIDAPLNQNVAAVPAPPTTPPKPGTKRLSPLEKLRAATNARKTKEAADVPK